MDSFYRLFPAEGQLDPSACWAACLRWWLFASKSIAKPQEDILSSYDCEDDGTVSEKTIRDIINDPQWGMTKEVFHSATKFTSAALRKHLDYGPVYVGYTETKTRKKHVNIIYDLEVTNGVTRVGVMEPQARELADWTFAGEHQVKSLHDFNRLGAVYVGSLKPKG
ncbi:MAG: papain-like cysteine protease family protein [Actinomycetota bacterium]